MSEYIISAQRREELRQSGVFPRSPDVHTFFLASAAFYVISRFYRRFQEFLQSYSGVETIGEFVDLLRGEILLLLLAFFVAVCVSSLFQSRFLFRLGAKIRSEPQFPLFNSLFRVFKACLLFGFGYLFFRSIISGDLTLFIGTAPKIGLGLLLIFALLERFCVGLLFNMRFAMSRGELSAESAEGEVRTEMKQASREAFF